MLMVGCPSDRRQIIQKDIVILKWLKELCKCILSILCMFDDFSYFNCASDLFILYMMCIYLNYI